MDQSDGRRDSDLWSDSRYIMKLKIIIFADESMVRYQIRETLEVERESKNDTIRFLVEQP